MKNVDKKLAAVVAVILILIGGSMVFALTRQDPKPQEDEATMNRQAATQTETTENQPGDTATTGKYIDYENGAIEKTDGTKVLYFHAPWCPQCQKLDADIIENGVPNGVTIFKVDFDSSHKLRQKYGVTLQTTLVKVDDNGDEISKYVAYDEPTLEAVKLNLL